MLSLFKSKSPQLLKLTKVATCLVMAVGVIIRLKVYYENRSLFIDEANLGRALLEGSYPDFFSILDYEQFAPPLFLVESRMVVSVLGHNEWALRLVPFIASLATLWILWVALQDFIVHPISRLYGLSLLAFSFLAIRYGTEFKQYSTDALLAITYLLWALKDREEKWSRVKLSKWVVLGVVGIWYSMPLVFVLSGVGLFLFSTHRKNWSDVLFVIFSWLVSFLLYYYFVLRHNIGTDYLEGYFQSNFLKFNTLSVADWSNNLLLLSDLVRHVTDKTAISIGFGAALLITGVIDLVKHNRATSLLLLVPLLVLFLASSLHFYPLVGRLIFFVVPLLILIMCLGLDKLWGINGGLSFLLTALVIVGVANKSGWQYLTEEMTFEEIKPCLTLLAQKTNSDDLLYVDYEAEPAYKFYSEHYSPRFQIAGKTIYGKWNTSPLSYGHSEMDTTLWILYSHAVESRLSEAEQRLMPLGASVICGSHRVRLLKIDTH